MDNASSDQPISIYVLNLEMGRFYVGQSIHPQKRINAHMNGKGSAWTRRFKPTSVKLCRKTPFTDQKNAEEIENRITLSLMNRYGFEKVRGGYWCNCDDQETIKSLLHHETYISSKGFKLETILPSSMAGF